jgi:dolichol kinase
MSGSPEDSHEHRAHNAREPELLQSQATIDYKSEFIRKSIHLCSLSFPIIYFFISKQLALEILVPMFLAFFIVDLARFYHQPVQAWFYRWFGWLLRKYERDFRTKRLTGATAILFSAIVCVLLFPKIIAINAFAILIIADSTSALFGRRFGKRRFFGKSLEGAISFFVSATVVVILAPKVQGLALEYAIGVFAAVVGAVVEAASTKVDDNLSVPLAIGLVMWALYALLLPDVNLYLLV